jgi:prefoldin subunit 5
VAIYHLHVGYISRQTGRSAVAAAAYRAGVNLRCERDGIEHGNAVSAAAYRAGADLGEFDFTKKRDVVYSEILLPDYAPRYFQDRYILWNAVEKAETRKNARTARDIDVALPREFNRREQIEVLQKFVRENFVDYGMIADFNIHDKSDGNPHAHIMLTTRDVSKDGFKGKNREWDKVQYLLMWRENWAKVCNEKLQEKESAERIDHRTLKAQGIDREPQIHIGVTAKALERKEIITERVRRNYGIISRNLNKEITALTQEKNEADQEARRLKHQAEQIAERAQYIRDLRNGNAHTRQKAEDYFKQLFKITPQQAPTEIKRLEDRARSLENLRNKLQEKIVPLIEERDNFEKLLADAQPEQRRTLILRHEHEMERKRMREHDRDR